MKSPEARMRVSSVKLAFFQFSSIHWRLLFSIAKIQILANIAKFKKQT